MLKGIRQRFSAVDAEWLFLVLIGAIVLGWFGGSGVILGVDSYFVLDPSLAIHGALSAWTSTASVGTPNFAVQTLPFYSTLWLLVHVFGYRVAQSIILWALVSLSALGLRAVLRACFSWPQSWMSSVAIVSSATLYALNPFTTTFVWRYQTWMELTWASLPWLASLIVLALRQRITTATAATAGSLILLIGGAAYPHILIPPIALLLVVIVAALLATADDRGQMLLRALTITGWWTISLLWWILPSLVFLHDFMTTWAAQYRSNPSQLLDYGSQFTSVANVVRLIGLFQLRLVVDGIPFYPWFTSFSGALGIALYAFPAMAISGVIMTLRSRTASKSSRVLVVALGVVWAVSIFLMKGGHAPFSQVNHALLRLPLGAAWQHPYDKFALPAVFCASVLAGALLLGAASWSGALRIAAVTAILVVIVLAEGWPAYTGQLLTPQIEPLPGSVAVVPAYYYALQSTLSTVDGFTLQLPARDNGETAFDWDRGAQTNNDPMLEYFNGGHSIVRMRTGNPYADSLVDNANRALLDTKSRPLILSALGVGSVVLHRDWDSRYFPVNPDVSAYVRLLRVSGPATTGAELLETMRNARGLKLPLERLDENSFEAGFTVSLNDVKREQTVFSTDNGMEVRWVKPGYFAIYAPQQSGGAIWIPAVPTPLRNHEKTVVAVSVRKGVATISLDGATLGAGRVVRNAIARSVFLGSENRFHAFAGTISDIWFQTAGESIVSFSAVDAELRKRAATYGWAVHNDGNVPAKIPYGSFAIATLPGATGLKIPNVRLTPTAFDISMLVRLNDVRHDAVLINADNGMAVRWIRPGYLEAISPNGSRIFSPPLALRSGHAFRLRFTFANQVARLFVDSIPVAGGAFRLSIPANAVFLGSASNFRPFTGLIANVQITNGDKSYALTSEPSTNQIIKHFGWRVIRNAAAKEEMVPRALGKLDVYLTPCPSPYVYVADGYEGDVQNVLRRHAACTQRSVAIGTGLSPVRCEGIKVGGTSSADVSGLDIMTSGNGRCLLTINTSFAPGWSLRPRSGNAKVLAHGVVNGFANGFLIETHGPAVLAFRFGRQRLIFASLAAGLLILLVNLVMLALSERTIFRVSRALQRASDAPIPSQLPQSE